MKKIISLFVITVFILCVTYALRKRSVQENIFECHAQLHTKVATNNAGRRSVSDMFISMHGNGKGYILISGSYIFSDVSQQVADGIVNFTYTKNGSYYSIRVSEKNPELINVLDILNYDVIKLKITKVNGSDYAISIPSQVVMMCTQGDWK
ncbi:hypothetical protein PJX95_03765 [Serratia rubidaea]|uniref:FidL-like membrane protein n=1 Tax=Serratia rubidaea TaxID=61652 RepID=A0ABS0MG03_SERRU|nr:hypothetical protein [Serratia rubidaea]MBH1931212.1 hypothetical protein [Serratia rubidaea]MDC6117174.1 hypothetical protein [Serratia rubidaea]